MLGGRFACRLISKQVRKLIAVTHWHESDTAWSIAFGLASGEGLFSEKFPRGQKFFTFGDSDFDSLLILPYCAAVFAKAPDSSGKNMMSEKNAKKYSLVAL